MRSAPVDLRRGITVQTLMDRVGVLPYPANECVQRQLSAPIVEVIALSKEQIQLADREPMNAFSGQCSFHCTHLEHPGHDWREMKKAGASRL